MSLIEKAAISICNVIRDHHDLEPIHDLKTVENPDLFLRQARAVLTAVRNLDEGMQNAGVDAASNIFGGWVDEGQVVAYHRAMIDAILEERA